MARWAGRCLCGAVGWESDAPLKGEGAPALNLCHCASCRRQTGAGVIGWVDLPREGFRWLGEATTAYESSPGVTRRFCGTCGTPMSWEHVEIPDEVHVMAAQLLDDGVEARHVLRRPALVHAILGRHGRDRPVPGQGVRDNACFDGEADARGTARRRRPVAPRSSMRSGASRQLLGQTF